MELTEEKLNGNIRAGRIDRVYYLFGKEPFLVKTYTDKLIKKTVGDDPMDFNFIRINGNPEIGLLSDYIDGLPVFAEVKTIFVNDVDPEKMDKETLDLYIKAISDVPETSVLIFSITGFQPDEKKAKTKKFIEAVKKSGTVCRLDGIPQAKIAGLIVKKAAKQGVVISGEDAMYLSERVLCNMTLISEETAKLITYVGSGGVITKEIIDKLVGKLLDTSIYELATAINSGKAAQAFRILDDLFAQRIESVAILNALSGAYLDFYRAKAAKAIGVLPAQAAQELGYPKNREWVLNKAMNAVSKLRIDYLRKTVFILSEADREMKSTGVDGRTIIEKAVAKLFSAREKMYV